jgi:hypothetical protein
VKRRRCVPGVDEEFVPPGEEAAIVAALQILRGMFERRYTNVRPVLRDQHPKSHGCVHAKFTVRSDVPADLRHGVFAEPRTYDAWIRFSSSNFPPSSLPAGNGLLWPDSKRDAHGMAIKLTKVDGDKILPDERTATTQDFLLVNSSAFFCRNAFDFAEFVSRLAEDRLWRFFLGPDPRKWRLRELVNGVIASKKRVVNPLQVRYWSQTPYSLGTHVVKYSARPRMWWRQWRRASHGRDFLEEAMARQLSRGAVSFDFLVQVRTGRMPIEDPTVRWGRCLSPFRKVATIRIPAQDFTHEATKDFVENLYFTPWHSLPEHRPMGGINRVRRVVYEMSSTRRHHINDALRREPRYR